MSRPKYEQRRGARGNFRHTFPTLKVLDSLFWSQVSTWVHNTDMVIDKLWWLFCYSGGTREARNEQLHRRRDWRERGKNETRKVPSIDVTLTCEDASHKKDFWWRFLLQPALRSSSYNTITGVEATGKFSSQSCRSKPYAVWPSTNLCMCGAARKRKQQLKVAQMGSNTISSP